METYCGRISRRTIGQEVTLNGWCRYLRDHGSKFFIDLADITGMSQLVFEGDLIKEASKLGRESVIKVVGLVRERDKDTVDKSNPTGEVEVYVKNIEIINISETPPFEIIEEKEKFLASEDIRLKYRYLDLRRKTMIENIKFRDAVTKVARKFFWENDFLELETPTLVRDTYETGARPFLVPSRIKKGAFYSLPQSPQIYKQIIMIAGLDKYFQVARAFRDEDQREDRQPEFTQLDFEVSFKDESYIMLLVENLINKIFNEIINEKIDTPFKRLKYKQAIEIYGGDKPDLRYDYEIRDLTEDLKETEYLIINKIIKAGGKAKGMCFSADYGKSEITKDFMLSAIDVAKLNGLKGLTWLFVEKGEIKSIPESIALSLSNSKEKLIERFNPKDGDIIVMGADLDEDILLQALGKVRKYIGDKIGKFKERFSFVWITDFPLFEIDKITKKLKPSHNPFTAPYTEDLGILDSEPEKVRGRQFDLVLNGNEIGGGAVRINNAEIQLKVLNLIGIPKDEALKTFGFLIEALRYGAPEDAGFAIGLDRFVALLKGRESIRDFILFPKTRSFDSPIDDSPSFIDKNRLIEDYKLSFNEL